MRFLKDKRNLVILLLSILFLIKIPQLDKRFFLWVLAGVFLCGFFDFLINNLLLKKNIFPKSAIISGFIVSGILDYRQAWWVLLIFSFLAILSKYTIKFNRKHIFNPANFSLFIAALFKIPLTWNIESNIFLIIIFGIYFTYSFKKIFHVLGFLFLFIILFALAKTNPFGLVSCFFVFIMLIEPKTSTGGALRGFMFGSLVAILSFLIFKFLPNYDFWVTSLFLANTSNFLA